MRLIVLILLLFALPAWADTLTVPVNRNNGATDTTEPLVLNAPNIGAAPALAPFAGDDVSWSGWGGYASDPQFLKWYAGTATAPLLINSPLLRTSAHVATDATAKAGNTYQFRTRLTTGHTGGWTNIASLLLDDVVGAGDHIGIQSHVHANGNRVAGGSTASGNLWGFHGFVSNDGRNANGIGAELNVYNSDTTRSYLDTLPDGAGPNSDGHFMTALQLLPDGSPASATRGISVLGTTTAGFDTGIALTGHSNVGIYINSKNTIAYRDAPTNAVPAAKTDIKWGAATSVTGIDMSAHTFTGPAIKLGAAHTISDGTVTKTLAQLAAGPLSTQACTGTDKITGYNATTNQFTCSADIANNGSGLTIQEVDSAPSGTPSVLKFPNGSLTDNGDGSYTYTSTATLGNMPANTIKGNNTAGTAAAADLTTAQVINMLGYESAGSWGLELGNVDSGNRTSYLDFHSADGVNYNARLTKASGLNSQFTFNNRGVSGTETGPIVFDAGSASATGTFSATGAISGTGIGATVTGTGPNAAGINTVLIAATPTALGINVDRGTALALRIPNSSTGVDGARVGVGATAAATTNAYMSLQTLTSGSMTEKARIHASGGVSVGSTTDPGAGNFSVSGYAIDSFEDKTASYTVSKDTGRITLATGTATVTLTKTLPAGTTSVLVTVAGAAASGVSFAAETGGSLSWGDAGAPTFTNSKTADVVCTSENAAATTAAAWRCVKGGNF